MELPAQFLHSLAHSGQAEMRPVRGTAEGGFKAASVILDFHAQAAVIEGQKDSDIAWRGMRDGVLDCLTNEHEQAPLVFRTKGMWRANTLDSDGNPRFRGEALGQFRYRRDDVPTRLRTVTKVPDRPSRLIHRRANLRTGMIEQSTAHLRRNRLCMRGCLQQGGNSDAALNQGIVHLSGEAITLLEDGGESPPDIADV